MKDIRIEINGEMQTLSSVSNVTEMLRALGISENRVAVEVNRRIIRRGEWESTSLSDMDHVEIVQFVGGG
jgi:thiamine biosynthesis protein ThiS